MKDIENNKIRWCLLGVFPNLKLKSCIEHDRMVLADLHDCRVKSIMQQSQNIKLFLGRFKNQFSDRVTPWVLIAQQHEVNEKFDSGMVVGFRNAVAISCLLRANRRANQNRQLLEPIYSGVFSLYPILPSADDKYMSINGIGILGLDDRYDKFHGQTDPAVSKGVFPSVAEGILLDILLEKWKLHFFTNCEDSKNERLFRSLQYAFTALSESSNNFKSIYDFGMKIVLWIAAFENLLHDGINIDRWTVEESFNLGWWKSPALSRTYVRERNNLRAHQKTKVNIASKMCEYLYDARDHFTHGNRISERTLIPFDNSVSVFMYAPLLYNCLLSKTLGIVDQFIDKNSRFSINDRSTWDCFELSAYRDELENSIIRCTSENEN